MELTLKDKLVDTTFLVRLNTGEWLLSIVIHRSETGVSLFFPYVIKGKDTLEEFCPYAKNRRFEISVQNCQMIKSPDRAMLDLFYTQLVTDRIEDFLDFLKYFRELITELESVNISYDDTQKPEDMSKDRILH